MIHLFCGPPGAGKTTQASRLARELNAVLLSLDDCLKPLSLPDSPDPASLQQLLEKAQACALKVLQQCAVEVARDREVVLDMAAFRRAQRDSLRDWASLLPSSVTLYYVSADEAIRRERVRQRNRDKGASHSFDVPDWVFDWMEASFESPDADEAAILIRTDNF
jgi:predicted kinase